ncbi:MAG TPA: hypothetical protein VHQ47_05005 [Phycisphaerae bacterium]|nr:hypothetical protein [Phycisphaerae bacterium]
MSRRSWRLTSLIAAILLASFLFQLPTSLTGGVADWQEFAFYDPGTVLKGDMLLAKGYIPTVDFGYTHGLLSLLYGRLGFALLGRSAWTFFALTLLCEFASAWAFARIALALRLSQPALILLLVGLPMAVLPAYLTLTHPLEAAIIALALAHHAEGKRARALWLLTLCLFVKPSMAYVYGALLVVIILAARNRRTAARAFGGAALIALLLAAALALWTGPLPVFRTLLPLTGAKTYAATGFGFFNTSGLALWWRQPWWVYIGTPVGMVLLGALVCAGSAFYAIWKLASARPRATPEKAPLDTHILRRREILATVALLELAFLLGFYGWTGSWTYYSYLLVWALVLATEELVRVRRWRWLPATLAVLLVLSYCELVAVAINGWTAKERPPAAGGLWVYPQLWQDWQNALAAAHGQPTLIMTNGWPPDLPPNAQLPDTWFPELGIPTAREIERVRRQVAHAQYAIRWHAYQDFEDVWNEARLARERAAFVPVYQNSHFTVLERATESPQSTRAAK